MHLNIIDYSLLIGIHNRTAQSLTPTTLKHPATWAERDEGGVLSADRKSLYFMGTIDILTQYNIKKKLEHFSKSLIHNGNEIS
jgi:1-phosphatidylinositol-4-phosphate 5-kinase